MNMHATFEDLNAGLDSIKNSPKDNGVVELIVIRPEENERQVLDECDVSTAGGVHGDRWAKGSWKNEPDGSPHPDVQVAIMNSRCVSLLTDEKSRWALAGDQFYVDLDLSQDNLPVGQKLSIGTAILEVTDVPHTGCKLFTERYGSAATKFVNSKIGRELHLRGIHAKVIRNGIIKTGDRITKMF